MKSRFLGAAAPLAAYGLLFAAVTWPLCCAPDRRVIGFFGYEDLYSTLWYFWLWKVTSLHLFQDVLAGTLSLSHALWRFFSFPLVNSFGNFTDFILTLPLDIFGFPLYYNLKTLLIFLFNALTMQMLLRSLRVEKEFAVLGGALFALTPVLLYQFLAGRTENAPVGWACLFILLLERAVTGKARADWLLAGACLALTALFYWFYGFFALLLGLLWFGALVMPLARGRRWGDVRAAAAGLAGMLLVALLLVSPFLAPYLGTLGSGADLPQVEWWRPFPSITDAGAVIDPSSPAPQDRTEGLARKVIALSGTIEFPPFAGNEWGLSALLVLLALLSAIMRERRSGLLLLSAAVFFVISLGPYLKLNDSVLELSGHAIRLPYTWLYQHVPFFSRFHWPNRALPFVALPLVVLLCLNLRAFAGRLALSGWDRALTATLIVSAVLMEMAFRSTVPLHSSPIEIPSFYRTLAASGQAGLLELLPEGRSRLTAERWEMRYVDMIDYYALHYYQTVHGKKFLWSLHRGGSYPAERAEVQTEAHREANSFLAWLHGLSGGPWRDGFRREDLAAVQALGYRYIVLHQKHYVHGAPRDLARGQEKYMRALESLSGHFGPPVWEGEEAVWESPRFEDLRVSHFAQEDIRRHAYAMKVFAVEPQKQ